MNPGIYLMELKKNISVFLIPVFFILHGYRENISAILLADTLKLMAFHLLVSVLFFFLLKLIIKSAYKSAVCYFIILVFYYLFGTLHDAWKNISPFTFLKSYSFILPLCFILLILLITYFKNSKAVFRKAAMYLNVLFALLILLEILQISSKALKRNKGKDLQFVNKTVCDSCLKPDIYLIIADEYTGSAALKAHWRFDNSDFENSLRTKGFHIIENSSSNYNYTLYSMASMFSMNYLNSTTKVYQKKDIDNCYSAINQNFFIGFLKMQGYKIENLSIFTLDDNPAVTEDVFPFMGTHLITHQTFFSRLKRDLGYHLVTSLKIKPFIKKAKKSYETDLRNNNLINRLIVEEAAKEAKSPKFVYAHITIPHAPFYYDQYGRKYTFEINFPDTITLKKRYLEYLQYGNSLYLNLVSTILQKAKRPTVIMLAGDHGSRMFVNPSDRHFQFSTVSAIFLPDKKYDRFYKGMSNVNELRVLLNLLFDQKLPILPDRSVFLNH